MDKTILTKEEKKEVMKRMKSEPKTDFVELVIEMKKIIKSMGEKCKISIRNIRREANDDLKNLLKKKDISEDEEKKYEKDIQVLTDNHIKIIDDKVIAKEKEIMTI